jgi:hypothetical protein
VWPTYLNAQTVIREGLPVLTDAHGGGCLRHDFAEVVGAGDRGLPGCKRVPLELRSLLVRININ